MTGGFGRPSAATAAAPPARPAADARSAAYRADGGDLAWGALRAASVTGPRHRLTGQPGEDAYAWAWSDDVLAVAVADGVGSVDGSAAAAEAAVDAACAAALRGGPGAGIAAAGDAVRALGAGATTLVVAVVLPSGAVRAARVGDSDAKVLRAGAWEAVFAGSPDDAGDGDELVVTRTAALPAAEPGDVEEAAADLAPGDALVLLTDGVAAPLADGPTTVAPTLAAALAAPPTALALAALTDFSRQGCHDDRTLLVVWIAPLAP